MEKNETKNKRIFRLGWQIALILTAFYIVIMVAGILVIRYGSTNTYLTAKNDMMLRDMESIKHYCFSDSELDAWLLEFWREHPLEMREELTLEEMTIAGDMPIYGMTETSVVDYLNSCTYNEQLALAKEKYNLLHSSLIREIDEFGYGTVVIIDVREEYRGFVYIQVNNDRDLSDHIIGDKWNYDLNSHAAAKKFLSGSYGKVEFEITNDAELNDQQYYFCASPFEKDGEVFAVLCIGYNWNLFYKDLMNELFIIALIMFALVLVVYLLSMLVINRIVTKPLSMLQTAVKGYTETNDSKIVAETVDKIHSKNEIGALSGDIKDLVFAVDNYVDEITKANLEIAEISNELLVSLALTIDAKDKYTNGHSVRVAKYSKMIAEKLGFNEKECEKIYRMGLLHDIGKIGIPNNIINKKGKLTDEEYAVIKTHTVQGYEILEKIESFPELAKAARWHHERFDGRGYPDNLKGEETPFEIRIISVADSYDAMTSNRSYRGYLPQEVVKAEIEKCSGTQFDPKIAEVMLRIIEEDKNYVLHENAEQSE